ncbi:MAG: glycosyltransferase family 9 protein [Roseiflexaceae bacterium]|nr:glycosyltransferase family 9 protein [Roseiflexaceae bacterium]
MLHDASRRVSFGGRGGSAKEASTPSPLAQRFSAGSKEYTVPVAPLANLRKIAVLRANVLGDFLFALPALAALRETYPAAEIVLLGLPWHRAFLEGRPGPVDRVVVMPALPWLPGGGSASPSEEARFLAAMRDERFDLAVQIHGGGRNSNPFLLQLGARNTVGLATDDAPRLDRTVPYVYYQSEIMRYLEVVAQVGAVTAAIEPQLAVIARDLAESREIVADAERLVVLHPGASDARRRWPVEQFAAVGDALAADGYTIGVSGVGAEGPVVEAVIGAMQLPARSLCDALSIGGFTGLLSRAALVVSNDTGPFHLAGAVGTPAVGIYWLPNLINSITPYRSTRRAAISWRMRCPTCDAPLLHQGYAEAACDHRESVVAEVPVDTVLGYARELLAIRHGAAA